MKQIVVLSLFLLTTLNSWAQYSRMRMPVADKSKEIPMKPVIVEGELTGVPDGTPVKLGFRVQRTRAWDTANNTLVDTLRNGKFYIEKKFIYKDFDENDDNVDYYLIVEGAGHPFFAYPGTTVKVTGTPSTRMDVITWRAESNHPLQKELYEYWTYEQEKLASIRKQIQEAYEADEVDDALVQKLERQRDSIDVVSMVDFMKNKECNSNFARNLFTISYKAKDLGNMQLVDRVRNLIMEKVPVDNDYQEIIEAKGFLSIGELQQNGEEIKVLKFGDKMKDFTLYDRKGNVHKLSEFKGKYTVLMFTSMHCGPCLEVMPTLDDFYKRNKDKVEVIAISVDQEKMWKEENNNVSFHEWNDRRYAAEIANVYGLKGTPCFVIIHPNGNVLDVSHGAGAFFKEMIKHVPDAEIEKMLRSK